MLHQRDMNLFTVFLLFNLQSFIEGGNQTSSRSEGVLKDIKSHLNIASQMIETAKEKIPEDMEELCKEFKGHQCQNITYLAEPRDCSDIYLSGERKDGLYNIWPQIGMTKSSLRVYCDMESNGGGWTVIQRRGDYGGPYDYFYKEWSYYKSGFGDMMKDFWIGNDLLFALTNQRLCQLRVNLTAWDGDTAYAVYDEFWISDETQSYKLHIKGYSGTAGDSLKLHNGYKFSTKDRKNDVLSIGNCAEIYSGAWWYKNCADSNLNGPYYQAHNNSRSNGVVWLTFKKNYLSLKDTVMKIRPSGFTDTSNSIA